MCSAVEHGSDARILPPPGVADDVKPRAMKQSAVLIPFAIGRGYKLVGSARCRLGNRAALRELDPCGVVPDLPTREDFTIHRHMTVLSGRRCGRNCQQVAAI